jgi:bifunctional enzyme CysN/CysC
LGEAELDSPAQAPAGGNESGIEQRGRSEQPPLRLLICGSAETGKSTLINRLLGRQNLTERRAFVVADMLRHEHDTSNLVAGASNADVALLLIDARTGMPSQTRRHALIASVLGIRRMVLAVNKMDLVGFEQAAFDAMAIAFTSFARELGCKTFAVFPISAREGDNVCSRSERPPWYAGPCLLEYLQDLKVDGDGKPLRIPVQRVDAAKSGVRGMAGAIASGSVSVGDAVAVVPSGNVSQVKTLACAGTEVQSARAGDAVLVTLGSEIEASAGDMLVAPRARPQVADQFAAHLVWLSHNKLLPGRSYLIKLNCNTLPATITDLKYRLDLNTLARIAAKTLAIDEVGVCNLAVARPVPFDSYDENRSTGAFILLDRYSNETVAAGVIDFALRRATNIHHQEITVGKAARSELMQHRPAVLWFTGLSGAGKSTIANCVESGLHARGVHTIMLDGDNIRHGLNKDLGFTEVDRVENIRRIGEVAKLMTEGGLIVLCAFISPFRAERRMVRELLPPDEFIEIFVDTPLQECIARDAKGLYRRALAGEIKNFTGVDQPYEVPERADLRLPGDRERPDALAERVIEHLLRRQILA